MQGRVGGSAANAVMVGGDDAVHDDLAAVRVGGEAANPTPA